MFLHNLYCGNLATANHLRHFCQGFVAKRMHFNGVSSLRMHLSAVKPPLGKALTLLS
jgi:hypothetical protein